MTTGSRQLLHRVTLVRAPASLPNLSIFSVPLEKRVYEPLRRLTRWVWSTLIFPFFFLRKRGSPAFEKKTQRDVETNLASESVLVMPKAASSLMNDEEVNEPRHPPSQSMSINLCFFSRSWLRYDRYRVTGISRTGEESNPDFDQGNHRKYHFEQRRNRLES